MPWAWKAPEGAGDKGSKNNVFKKKSGTEKARDVLGNVGNILKSVL